MSNITPTTPSFTFGYWKPWKENSNLFDSFLDYAKDVSLTKYGADTVGTYINQASKEQVQAINELGQAIGRGMNVLSNQMSDINQTLVFLNRNMDIQIEQQKLSNLLLQNIAELLRVPDSEKERQHSIELGIKFFVNAKKDSDLYADSLEELLKAESLMKQDYFVLHRIGCIYLYVEKYINPEKAFEYFVRAAKYASVESDPGAVRLANALTNNFNTANSELNNPEERIGLLAADSYEKGAFAAYVLGRFEDAVNYQSKALKFNSTSENRFILSKYQVRNNNLKEAVDNLDKSIDEAPYLAIAAFKELDLINEPEVIKQIAQKNEVIDNKIKLLTKNWKTVESTKASEVIKELSALSKKSYEIKIAHFNKYENEGKTINNGINELEGKIDAYINELKQTIYCTFDADKIQTIINELKLAKDLPLEKMQVVFDKLKTETDADNLKIGSKYGGGIVFYLDDSGKHGLVCAEKDFGKAIMRANKFEGHRLNIGEYGISLDIFMEPFTKGRLGEPGRQYSIALAEKLGYFAEEVGFFKNKMVLTKAYTAPRLCLESKHNGFDDWYLPTIGELLLIHKLFLQLFDDSGEGRNGRFPNNFFDFKDDAPYWSSSMGRGSYTWPETFLTGSKTLSFTREGYTRLETCFGTENLNVRAVRAF